MTEHAKTPGLGASSPQPGQINAYPKHNAPGPDLQDESSNDNGEQEGLADAVKRLAALPPMEYEQVRKSEAKRLGVRVSILDENVNKTNKTSQQTASRDMFPEVEEWPAPVDGNELLDAILETIERFIICNSETAVAAALWITFTWLIDHFEVAPRAMITAPEKRCGKTLLLELMAHLCRRPLPAGNVSTAATFRSIDAFAPTLLIDEVDTFMRDNEELRGVVNSGHSRQGYVLRCVGDNHEPTPFYTFCAMALAGIGRLPGTIEDRSVILRLRRKRKGEEVERLRSASPALWKALRGKLQRWALDNGEALQYARPDLPEALNDRAQDNWEPLLAIADMAGGDWPKMARDAALKLSAKYDDGEISTRLLADIRDIFQRLETDRILSFALADELRQDPDQPWQTYARGKPISPHQIARLLAAYRIKSKSVRTGKRTHKGYMRADFEDAFERYLPPAPAKENGTTAQMAQTPQPLGVSDVPDCPENDTLENGNGTRKPPTAGSCDGVTFQNGGTGQGGCDEAWEIEI